MGRKHWSVALVLFLCIAVLAGEASGQGLGNFFAPFFAPRDFRPPPVRRITPPQRQPAAPPRVVAVPKNSDAAKVLVIGDFLAGELADGLTDVFSQDGKLASIDRSDAASGLVRTERIDWSKLLPQLIRTHQPSFIVVMIGTNDRQPISTAAGRLAFRSDAWEAAYRERVEALAAGIVAAGKPAYWVGLPPMRSAAAQADMAYLNGLTRPKVELAGIRFVDVWDAFSDKEGRFVANGPDTDGQIRPLRLADGTSFTRAGQRRLAAPVEQALRGGRPAAEPAVAAAPAGRIVTGPNGQRWLVGPTLALGEPATTSVALAGETATAVNPLSVQYRLVVQGAGLPTVPGRVDDFAWPRN